MATISSSLGQTPADFSLGPQSAIYSFSKTRAISTVSDNTSQILSGSLAIQALYRGVIFSEFVYSLGTPPQGASDIIIVGYPEGED